MAIKSDYISGTLTITQGSTAFTGTGTGWRSAEFKEGDTLIDITGATEYMGVIEAITGEATGTLTKPWEGPTLTNVPYRMRYQPDGARSTAQARNLIEILGNGNITAFALLNGAANLLPMFTGPGAMTLITRQALVSGAAYDVQVATLADRAAYDGQDQGYAVLVSNIGDGRAAIYSKNSATSGDWSDPAFVTGAVGPIVTISAGTTTTLDTGLDATVNVRPVTGGYELDFGIPRGLKGDTGLTGDTGATGPKGDNLSINASGTLAERDNYNSEAEGFAFVDTENGNLYFREGPAGNWSDPIPFGKGDPGLNGSLITTTNGVGNGTAGPYTLNDAPSGLDSILSASISGVLQYNYIIDGTGPYTITFSIPVATGVSWQVKQSGPLSIGLAGALGNGIVNSQSISNDPAEQALIKNKIGAGDVFGPASSVNNRVAVFDGTTGKLIKDGGQTIAEVITAANNQYNFIPQGRLTLTSGQPVQIANATSASTIYYTPFNGDKVSLWNGSSSFVFYEFTELTLTLSTNHIANTNYDLYIVRDGGIIYLATGPAWTGDNNRGTGAGTAETEFIKGVIVNKNAITVRPGNTGSGTTISVPARAATLVGWVRTTVIGQTEYTIAPTPAVGGTNNKLFLGNAYNKRTLVSRLIDTSPSWTYSSAAIRAMNAGAGPGNRISFIIGDPADVVEARLSTMVGFTGASGFPVFGLAIDSSTIFTTEQVGGRLSGATPGNISAAVELALPPGLGFHYIQCVESNLTAIAASYLGGDQFRFTAKLAL